MACSVIAHGVVLGGLALIPVRQLLPVHAEATPVTPREILIGDRLYFVTQLPSLSAPPPAAKQKQHRTALAGKARQTLIQPDSPGAASLVDPLPSFEIRAARTPESEISGEHANILSVNPQPLDLPNRLIVPPGNAIAEGGDSNSTGATEAGDSAAPPLSSSPVVRETAGDRTGTAADNTWKTSTVASKNELPTQPEAKIIERSPSGNFDAVIVQASPNPSAEGSLLQGRPVYTVYIAVGTPKDWMLYFCVPGESASASTGPVVRLNPSAVVRPPWPTHLVVPQMAPPAGEKYVLIHGSVDVTGKFQNLTIVRPLANGAADGLLNSLAAWEFRPATKDGVPVVVEALLSIPLKS
jgi:hypothetical protein